METIPVILGWDVFLPLYINLTPCTPPKLAVYRIVGAGQGTWEDDRWDGQKEILP